MSINERAKQHYDNAVALFTAANNPEIDNETTYMLAHLAHMSLELADFASVNHALVAGIDDNPTIQPPTGPPLPPHIAAQWEAAQQRVK